MLIDKVDDNVTDLDEIEARKQISDALNVLQMAGPQQMLIHSAYGNSGGGFNVPERQQLLTLLGTLGMPQQTLKNIAIANGNGTGQSQGYNTLAELIKIRSNSFTGLSQFADITDFWSVTAGIGAAILIGTYYDVKFDVHAMPGYTNTEFRVYRGKVSGWFLFLPVSVSSYEVKVKNVQGYDAAPGGVYDLSQFATGVDFTAINSYSGIDIISPPNFCFVPTVSALNIVSELSNPYYQIPGETLLVSQSKTNFNEVHLYNPPSYLQQSTPQYNSELHVAFTPSNADIFANYLFNNNDEINDEQAITTLHKRTYNFGANTQGSNVVKTNDRLTRDLTVSGDATQNGVLCVNCANNIAFTDISSNPLVSTSNFSVILTGNCNSPYYSELIIDDFGVLEIGVDENKTGSFSIHRNNRVRLKSGGVLRIHDGSQLIVSEGANFIFEDGATIELLGPNAELVIKGKVTVGDNATLTFSGSGHMVIDQFIYDGVYDNFWNIGQNAKLELIGSPPKNTARV